MSRIANLSNHRNLSARRTPATGRKDLHDLTLRAQRLFSPDVALSLFVEIGSAIPIAGAPEAGVELNESTSRSRTEGDQRALPKRDENAHRPGTSFCRDRAMWVKRLLSLLLFRKRREHRCSFCNTPQSAVRQLIAGASAFICDECVAVCEGIVVAQHATTPGERPHATSAIAICLLCKRGKPESECILVPTRGPVCVPCVETVKAAAASTRFRDDSFM